VTAAPLAVVSLGRIRYAEADALQHSLCQERIAGRIDRDILLLLEHEPTITLGRGTRPSSLPLAPEELKRRGLTVVEVDRGGDVTWHGPGQLVGYPILDLTAHRRDLHWYLRQLEAALILGLQRLGLPAERNPGLTGVWTGGRKIASIGIHVRQWVTTHGFALNVNNRLDDFGLIVPCGIDEVVMTTVADELDGPATERPSGAACRDPAVRESFWAARRLGGSADLWETVSRSVTESFGQVFDLSPVLTVMEELVPGAAALRIR
jgi:lipoate-protein ligase B